MPDVCLQILRPASGRVELFDPMDVSTLGSFTRTATPAEMYDGDDGTYDEGSAHIDTVNYPEQLDGSPEFNVCYQLDACDAHPTISFVRAVYRASWPDWLAGLTSFARPSSDLQELYPSPPSFYHLAADAVVHEYSDDIAVDIFLPGHDGLAWTPARINARTWGARFYMALNADPPSAMTSQRVRLHEFRLEVWGPQPPASSATPVSARSRGAGTVPVMNFAGAQDPQSIVSQERHVIRVNDATLGDGNAVGTVNDFVATGSPGHAPNPAGGTVKVTVAALRSVAAEEVVGWSAIDHVRFGAVAIQVGAGNPSAPANRRFFFTLRGVNATAPANVDASVSTVWARRDDGIADGDIVVPCFAYSDDVHTRPGGGAWEAADVLALANVGVGHDYPAAWTSAYVEVAELWVEVYGKAGAPIALLRFDAEVGNRIVRAEVGGVLNAGV